VIRASLVAIAIALALLPSSSAGHTRSQSFSTWQQDGDSLRVVFSVSSSEATRLAALDDPRLPLPDLLTRHLSQTISARAGDVPCERVSGPTSRRARAGQLRAELRFRCGPDRPLALEIAAFGAVAPSHTHFARFKAGDEPEIELLFSNRVRQREAIARAGDSATGASFLGYVRLGMEHIAGGADHLAFLVALLLFVTRTRDAVVIVTGFTLGHSLTLALAAYGIARPEPGLVEALIGFTIALVAVENLTSPSGESTRTSLAIGLALLGLALVATVIDRGPPPVLLLGLAFFTVCYGRLASTPESVRRLRPALTFLFGLVHGFGFAGVLLEVGLPRDRLLAALLGFNLGVELGQVVFVGFCAGLIALLRGVTPACWSPIAREVAGAGLCGMGLYWFVQRGYALLWR
jgi:hypothetical protein